MLNIGGNGGAAAPGRLRKNGMNNGQRNGITARQHEPTFLFLPVVSKSSSPDCIGEREILQFCRRLFRVLGSFGLLVTSRFRKSGPETIKMRSGVIVEQNAAAFLGWISK